MAHVFTGLAGNAVLHTGGGQAHMQQQHPTPGFDVDMLLSDPNADTSDDSEQQHAPSKCRLSDAGTTSAAAAAPGGLWQPDGCAMADWQQHQTQQQQQGAPADAAAAAAAADANGQDTNLASKDSSATAAAAVPADPAAAAAAVAAPRSSDDSTAAQQQQQALQQFTLHCGSPVDPASAAAAAAAGAGGPQQPQQLQFTAVNVSGAPTPDLQQHGLTIQSIQPMIVADAAMLQQIIQQQQQQVGGAGTEGGDGKQGVVGNIPLSLPAVYDEHALQQLLQQVVATAPDTDTAIWQQQQQQQQQAGVPSTAAAASAAAVSVSSPTAGGKDSQLKLLHLVPLAKQLQPALPAIAPIGGAADSPTQQAGSNPADAAANAAAAEASAAADAAVAAAATAPNAAAAAALAGNMLSAGPSGMQVFVASPAGKPGTGVLVPASMLSPGVFTPGANKEELKGCCEALMMLRDLSKPGEDGTAGGQTTGVIAMMPNKPGAGAAAALAAVRSTAAMVAEAPAAAVMTMPVGAGASQMLPRGGAHPQHVKQEPGGPQQQQQQQQQGHMGEPQLGRGKRVRKPQQWSQQMQLLDQLVDSVEHSAGSSGDFHAHPQAQVAAVLAAAVPDGGPAAKRQKQRHPGQVLPGGVTGFEDDEADESYDAAADANGDEDEAAELADYEEELMQYDQGDGDAAAGAAAGGRRRSAGKRGGGRGRYMPRKLKDTKAIFERGGGSAADADMPAPLSHSWGSCSYLGVSKKRSGKWQAAVRFGHDGSYAFWCCYGCPKQAARARDAAALALRGPAAARLNFPEDSYSDAEVLAAAAHILQKHPHLHPLEHPLLRAMSLADILGGGPGDMLGSSPAVGAAAGDAAGAAAAAADGGDGSRGVPTAVGGSRRSTPPLDATPTAPAAAQPAAAASMGGKSRMGARQKSNAAAQAERVQHQQQYHQQQQNHQEQQQQQDDVLAAAAAAAAGDNGGSPQIDTATMFSRLFDLAALVVFGPCAATETPASAFYPEELAAAAAAMSCRMPPGGLASVQEHLQSLAQAQQEQQRLQEQGMGMDQQQEQDLAGMAVAQEDIPAVVKHMQA